MLVGSGLLVIFAQDNATLRMWINCETYKRQDIPVSVTSLIIQLLITQWWKCKMCIYWDDLDIA